MATLEPAQALMADLLAQRLLLRAILMELLGTVPDRKAAAEKLLHTALNIAETEPIDLPSPDLVDAMRDAVGERISAIIAGALGPPSSPHLVDPTAGL